MSKRDKPHIINIQNKQAFARDEFVSVVILGENHGYRMKSYGPISLIEVDGKTIIEHQIDTITSVFPRVEILICCGFSANKITSFIRSKYKHVNVRIVENQLFNNANCCESVRLCLNNTMNNRFIVLSGELVINSQHLESINLNRSSILVQKTNPDKNLDIGVIHNNGSLIRMTPGITNCYWSEILSLSSDTDLRFLNHILSPPDYKNKLVFEAINELLKKSSLDVVYLDKPVQKVNNIKTFKKVSRK